MTSNPQKTVLQPKILHFYRTYYPDTFGGIEQVINQLCQATAEQGFQNDVLTLSRNARPETLSYPGHQVHRAHLDLEIASNGFSISAIRMFSSLAAKADIVHYHFPWPFADLAHFLVRHGKPTVVTYHSDIVRQKVLRKVYYPLMQRFLSATDRIVATSPNYLASSPVLQAFQEKVQIIPFGLSPNSYPKASKEKLATWRNQLPEKFFLFVGALRYYKGLHVLLDALPGADYPTVILGGGPAEDELRAHAKRNGLANILFLGALPDEDRAALLNLCTAIVFPAHLRSEAFGIFLLEAAMHGKPMISTELGTGTSYVNADGKTGYVVPPNDAPALRKAMDELWRKPALVKKMGSAAKQRFQELFSAEKMAAGYISVYNQLLSRQKNR